ncbi:hypothetical protein C8R41DRAFT_916256 [Lentinula lateritia]|uniref:Uncharacterized protein n=1 Tax=Lentinula lateritia TaxID=40482 RepID=A0ABQ8VQU0_9AGAR|nr:hypothetical protein C8R41DRAFT_916256 [Lentinula lateritia]
MDFTDCSQDDYYNLILQAACGGAHSNISQPASDFNVAMKAQDSLEPSAGDHNLGNEIAVVSEVAVAEQDCNAQVDAVPMNSLVNDTALSVEGSLFGIHDALGGQSFVSPSSVDCPSGIPLSVPSSTYNSSGVFSPSTHPSPPGIYDGLSGSIFNGPPPGVGNGPSPGIYNATAAHICNAPGVFNATAPAPGVYVYGAAAPGVYDAAAPQVHNAPAPGVYGAPAPHVHNVTAPGIYNGPHSIFNNWSGVYGAGICGLPGVYGAGIYGPPGAYGPPGIYSLSGVYGAGVHDPDVYNPAQNPAHNFAQAHGPGIQYGTPAHSHGLSRYHPYQLTARQSSSRTSLTATSAATSPAQIPVPVLTQASLSPNVPAQLPTSVFLPQTNQVIPRPKKATQTSAITPEPLIEKPSKGPVIFTSACNFKDYCSMHQYDWLSAIYKPRTPGDEQRTSTTYYQWSDARKLAMESVGYTGGLDLRRYKICYNNGEGKVETLDTILETHLGWNRGTFKASTRVFECFENHAINSMWDPNHIPINRTNSPDSNGLISLDKEDPYEVWKGIEYLFYQPGFFKTGDHPSRNERNSKEEQIAAQVSQKDMSHHRKKILTFLIPRQPTTN